MQEPLAAGAGGPTGFAFPPPSATEEDAAPAKKRFALPQMDAKKAKLLLMVAAVLTLGAVARFTFFSSSAPAPDAAAVKASVAPVRGLDYQAAPPAAVEQLESFLAGLPEVGEKLGAVEAQVVSQAGRPAGVVLAVGVQPDALREMDKDAFKAGIQATSPTPVVEKTRAGRQTYETHTGQFYSVMFTDDAGYIFAVQGFNKKTALKISKGLGAPNV